MELQTVPSQHVTRCRITQIHRERRCSLLDLPPQRASTALINDSYNQNTDHRAHPYKGTQDSQCQAYAFRLLSHFTSLELFRPAWFSSLIFSNISCRNSTLSFSCQISRPANSTSSLSRLIGKAPGDSPRTEIFSRRIRGAIGPIASTRARLITSKNGPDTTSCRGIIHAGSG